MLSFSEAMRLGATMGRQVFGEELGNGSATCAFGAAVLAAGLPLCCSNTKSISLRDGSAVGGVAVGIPDEWVPTFFAPALCPACGKSDSLIQTVAHLNDDHRWPREQIANFVQVIERKLGTPTQRENRAEAGDSRESATPDCSPALAR